MFDVDGRARPKMRGTGCKPIKHSFHCIRHCVIAMNIVVPLTTELSLQRRGGARKPINTLHVSQSDWCDWYCNVLRRQSFNLIGAA